MPAQLRSEIIKLLSLGFPYLVAMGTVALTALLTWATIANMGASNMEGTATGQQFYVFATYVLAGSGALLGTKHTTNEFRYGSIVTTLLAAKSRLTALLAKAVVTGSVALLIGLVSVGVMFGLASALTPTGTLRIGPTDLANGLALAASAGWWCLVGVFVGTVIRAQVPAVLMLMGWVIVVESIGAGLLGDAGMYLPGQALRSLAGLPGITVGAAALSLCLVTAATASVAALTLDRRDLH
jgi:hypothetical protein